MRRTLETFAIVALIIIALATIRFPMELGTIVGRYIGLVDRLDPTTLHLAGEFVENNLGTARESDGSLTVRMIAQQYLFVPQCVVVPAGVAVRFRITSADTVHMLTVAGTEDGIKVVPGFVSESRFTFPQPGTFAMPCHEFCGVGHYAMRSRLVVVPKNEFQDLTPDERVKCGQHE